MGDSCVSLLRGKLGSTGTRKDFVRTMLPAGWQITSLWLWAFWSLGGERRALWKKCRGAAVQPRDGRAPAAVASPALPRVPAVTQAFCIGYWRLLSYLRNNMRVILRERAENKLVTLERVGLLAFASPVVSVVFISFPWAQDGDVLVPHPLPLPPAPWLPRGKECLV